MPINVKIEDLLTRGVENVYPDTAAFAKALAERRITIYHGIDPTGPTLHLGHMVQLLKLKQFQTLGHKVIILIGDFTAMIGDPSDKSAVRQKLTRRQVLANARDYKKQIGRFLDIRKVQLKYNSKWLSKLRFAEILELTSNFTAQQTLARDMFKKRIESSKDLFLHEFLYPVLQAYDSVAMDVDAELGGNDQMFNMLAGRTLMRKLKNKEKFVMTTKLLVDAQGVKMGKTQGNMAKLSDTPEDMFGKIMSWPDEFILSGFELLTEVPMTEIEKHKTDIAAGKNPKEVKMLLARAVTALNFGVAKAGQAEKNFQQVHEKKEMPSDLKEVSVRSKNLVDVLVELRFAASKSEARRFIEQKGVKVNGRVADDVSMAIPDECVIQRGKLHFAKISRQ